MLILLLTAKSETSDQKICCVKKSPFYSIVKNTVKIKMFARLL